MRRQSLRTAVAVAALAVLAVLPAHAQQGPVVPNEGIGGRPVFERGGWGPAYYVWSDQEGFHVHWSARGDTRQFRGEVSTDGTITQLRSEDFEPEDSIRRTTNSIYWEAQASTGSDGFVFTVSRSADWIRFSLYAEGRLVSPQQIFIGSRGSNPSGNPFVFRLRGGEVFRDRWPAAYRGQPPMASQFIAGYFIWVEDDVWHVRWASRGGNRELSGLIATEGSFQDVRTVQLERDDAVARDQRLLAWESRSRGGVDGIDFRTTGERLNFTLLIDGVPANPSQIFIGASGAHPARNPWRVTR